MKRTMMAAVAAIVLLSACGGSQAATTTFAPDGTDQAGEAQAPTATTAAANDNAARTGVAIVEGRKVIYDGSMHLQATDTRAAFEMIGKLALTSGGFIAASNVGDPGDNGQPDISITLRLPADGLTATLAKIREVADRVVTESIQSQDVTDQFVDIEAQLRNLTALETELLALLAELRDNNEADPSKLLQVFDQIRMTRGEIEQLEGRRQMLTNLVSLATLQVAITPLPASVPIVPENPVWEPGTQARGALRELVESLQGLGSWAIRFSLYTLPVLILTLGPLGLGAWFIYRRLKRRPAPAS